MFQDIEVTTRRLALGLISTFLFAPAARSASQSVGTGSDNVDAAARRLVADRLSPGVQIAVLRHGSFLFRRGYGSSNLEAEASVTDETVFKIGSITKQFTAAAILLLQEDGKLSIDDSLAKYYPDFPRAGEITLRQMMSHTAGIGNYTATDPPGAIQRMFRIDYSDAELYQLMVSTTPLFIGRPGDQWAYSNTAYVLLGLIIGKITGQPYRELFRERLFRPAGLTRTAVDDAAQVVAGRAAGYSPGQNGQPFQNASYISTTVPGAAGNVRSTATDLCLWHAALFGERILKPRSFALMTAPVRLNSGALPTAQLAGPGKPPETVRYGFGLFVETVEGQTAVGHGGGINGFAANFRTFPDAGLTLAILLNIDAGLQLLSSNEAFKLYAPSA